MTTRRRVLTILAGAATLPFLGAKAQANVARWQGIALGARAQIVLDHPKADQLISMAVSEIIRLEGIFSLYQNDSQLSRLNRDGVLVEALNPKTAAFFLAFIPQFLDPAGASPTLQFILLGAISVTLNTLADVVVVLMASATRTQLIGRPHLMRRLTQGSGVFIASLGLSLALARRPANG